MEVSNALRNWAIKEMEFMPSGRFLGLSPPTPQDFSRLCRGQMINIWTYMMKHVRSSATVHKIRHNLKLQDIHAAGTPRTSRKKDPKQEEIKKLKAEKALCQTTLNAKREKLGQAEKEFQQAQKKLITADSAFREEKSKLDALKKKTIFLHLCMQVAAEKNQKLEQCAKYLGSVGTSLSGPRLDDSSCLQWPLEDRSECLCQLHLENVCSNYSDLLLESMTDARDGETLAQKHQRLIDMTRKLSTTFSDVELFTALSKLVKNAVNEMTLATAQCNQQQELEILKFNYSSGELIDMSNPPEITQSVASVLQEIRAAHAKTFFDTRRAQNNTMKTQKLFEAVKKGLWMQLQEEIDDQGIIELVHQNLELQLEVAACNATLECLQKCGKELTTVLKENSNLTQKLEKQIEQIKNFERSKATMLHNIQKCISLNINVHGQLNHLQFQITNYIEENLIGKDQDLVSAIEPLWGHLEEELNLMKAILVDKLQTITTDSQTVSPLQSLSIYPSVPVYNSREQSKLGQVQHTLGFPVYKSPDALLLYVLEKKLERAWLKTFHKGIPDSEKIAILSMGGRKYSIAELEDLPGAVAEHDQIHLETTVPLLKKTLTDIQYGLDLCVDLRTLVNDWWEQPAQHIPCSVTVGGHTFQEWKTLWMKERSQSSLPSN